MAFLLCALLLTPLATLADPDIWTRTNPVPLFWALVLILMSLALQGATPGKRWMKLVLVDAGPEPGCLTCRELRRLGWALALGLEALLHGLVPAPLTTGLLALGLGLLGWHFLWPALSGAADFPHNAATRVQIAQRA